MEAGPISNVQKLLRVVILLQIAVVGLLYLKLGSIDASLEAVLNSTTQTEPTKPNDRSVTLPVQANMAGLQNAPDSRVFRQIVREELVAALNDIPAPIQNEIPVSDTPVYDEIEMDYRRELALVQMESLKAQTEVSSADLERMMGDIAKLNPKNRNELFKLLNQAINRGEIKGHL